MIGAIKKRLSRVRGPKTVGLVASLDWKFKESLQEEVTPEANEVRK